MKMYIACPFEWEAGPAEIEVKKVTPRRVYFRDGKYDKKEGEFLAYFPSRLEAAHWLEKKTMELMEDKKRQYQEAIDAWSCTRSMRIEMEKGGDQ
jgi:hypothetical protein